MPRASAKPDEALLVRAVRFARLPGHGNTVPQACAKFGITPGAYRRAARELGERAAISSDEDYILAALHPEGLVRVPAIIYYYAWINHAGIKASRVRAILRRLIAQGRVRQKGDRFELAREWP